jgi:hypothetical protein
MTRINWDEVNQLTRLDEIIAYSIITLEEAYTAPDNYDTDIETKKDISQWVRWEIAYDEQGRAFFRYAASLYVVDRSPMADNNMLLLINAPTKYLVNHGGLTIEARVGDTSLTIDTLTDIPTEVQTMEQLLFWAIVLGDWWNSTLYYCGAVEVPDLPATPIGNWGLYVQSPGVLIEGEANENTIDSQFDAYNGSTEETGLPDFLKRILDGNSDGSGSVDQEIDLPSKDSGAYRENLVTCEEQDPAIVNYSQQQLEALLPKK